MVGIGGSTGVVSIEMEEAGGLLTFDSDSPAPEYLPLQIQ